MKKKLIGWSLGATLLATGLALVMSLPTSATAADGQEKVPQSSLADDAQSCEAASNQEKMKKLKQLIEAGYEIFKLEDLKTPATVTVTEKGVTFDPEHWQLVDLGNGLISFDLKKKKPKKPNPGDGPKIEKYVTCLCYAKDGEKKGPCETLASTTTNEVICPESAKCPGNCRAAIVGLLPDLTEAEFELP